MRGGRVPWVEAWHDALYGPAGFYRQPGGPAGHFTTASHGPLGEALARALLRLADRYAVSTVVDLGAGRGELLSAMVAADPSRSYLGVDIVPRPERLDDRIDWLLSPGGAALPNGLGAVPNRTIGGSGTGGGLAGDLMSTLVVANEWLDVVPCPVAEVDDDGVLREVLVDPATGVESLGGPLDPEDLAWADRWWPATAPGRRVEVGRPRDEAWAGLLSHLDSGVAVAVDYGHTRGDRPAGGTLTAYRQGRQLPPGAGLASAHRGDGAVDLTAHVAVDSLRHDRLLRQRDALGALGLAGTRPHRGRVATEPAAYLRDLATAGAVGELRRPGGLGDFWWVLAEPGDRPEPQEDHGRFTGRIGNDPEGTSV